MNKSETEKRIRRILRPEDGKETVEQRYTCSYCGYSFTRSVRRVQGYELGTGKQSKHKGNVSDSVKCPYCNNYLKTWS